MKKSIKFFNKYSSINYISKMRLKCSCVLILILTFTHFSFSQTESKILLINPNPSRDCLGETKEFRNLLKRVLWATNLFNDSITVYGYDRENRRGTFNNYCTEKNVHFYLTSKIFKENKSNDEFEYKINFSLFNLEKQEIENPNFQFSIKTGDFQKSVEIIVSVLEREIKYFNEHEYEFKELVNVGQFMQIDPDAKETKHTTDFPIWMKKILNSNPYTSKIYQFHFVEGIDEYVDNYISGHLDLLEEKDSLNVIFLMHINQIQNEIDLIISNKYKAGYTHTSDTILNKVITILRNQK